MNINNNLGSQDNDSYDSCSSFDDDTLHVDDQVGDSDSVDDSPNALWNNWGTRSKYNNGNPHF
ncbi:hypothetical protein [Candidatus Ichthyocystis hellenicum]|uniref:hypothetical protein n=1 Tax=Candidatus Ichthyocystis hellenicum TaxID=1561003 RepID=UPI00111215A2|nr:hypothetical protein [Candidatus Ichthyocystis hellenicum]